MGLLQAVPWQAQKQERKAILNRRLVIDSKRIYQVVRIVSWHLLDLWLAVPVPSPLSRVHQKEHDSKCRHVGNIDSLQLGIRVGASISTTLPDIYGGDNCTNKGINRRREYKWWRPCHQLTDPAMFDYNVYGKSVTGNGEVRYGLWTFCRLVVKNVDEGEPSNREQASSALQAHWTCKCCLLPFVSSLFIVSKLFCKVKVVV